MIKLKVKTIKNENNIEDIKVELTDKNANVGEYLSGIMNLIHVLLEEHKGKVSKKELINLINKLENDRDL